MREFFEVINEYPFTSVCIACFCGIIIGMITDAIKNRR